MSLDKEWVSVGFIAKMPYTKFIELKKEIEANYLLVYSKSSLHKLVLKEIRTSPSNLGEGNDNK
ncbi:MAG: hypothetical protein JSW06_00660 [Thermoplasmatales archaeon]|nr:MAG: hypothetical protein JSW06_00660 [Thermoplasmatales archaeon]